MILIFCDKNIPFSENVGTFCVDCQGRISKSFEKIEYLSEYVDDQNVVKNL